MLKSSDSINFWREEDIVDLDCPLRFIVVGNDPRGEWPGEVPTLTDLRDELLLSRVSYLRLTKNREGKTFISLLSGRLIVNGHVVEKDFVKKLFLNKRNGIEYASNKKRGYFIATGKRVRHDGIFCGEGFSDEGFYTQQILDSKNIRIAYEDEEDAVEDIVLTYDETELLDTLEQFVDSEFEVEQQTAQETPPFSYFNLRPEPRSVVYRQFFRIDVDSHDLERMRELKVNLVTIETQREDVLSAEIVDLSPSQDKEEIIISLEKQVPSHAIPPSGLLRLDALPTLKNVRGAVIDQLRQKKSANQWLVPLAAGSYSHPDLKPAEVIIPPREFPPNPSQVDALERGAGTDDYLLVLGPPGTGKTTVILDWVRYFVGQGKRVLITSQSNMAVDNVLERLAKEKKLECVRLGNETKVSSTIRDILIDNFSTKIQRSLIERSEETRKKIARSANEVEKLFEKLPKVKDFKQQLQALEKEQKASLTEIASKEKQIKKLLGNLDTSSRRLEKIEAQRRDREQIYQRRAGSSGFFSLFPKMLSHLDASKVARLDKSIIGKKKIVERYENEKRHAENICNAQQEELNKINREISLIEVKFRNFFEVSDPVIPELLLLPEGGIKGFNESQVKNTIATRARQYEKLQEIISEWQKVFSGERQKSIYQLLLSMVDVVGATCIGINTNRTFKDVPFDVVIVDESGQIQLHNLIVPLSRGSKAILVGDHKQLPPVVQDEIKQELSAREVEDTLLSKSWFEILWNEAPENRKAMMNTQFRCPSVISDFVSEAFYEGKYKAGPNTGPDMKGPIFNCFRKPLAFIDTSQMPESRRREQSSRQGERNVVEGNRLETEIVLDVLERVLEERPELGINNEIGIIVPYANHVKQIQKAIRRDKRGRFRNLRTPLNELVASVDSFQGQERDLVIMAFSRSNRGGNVGFLSDWRRLNVAMTRTKKQLVLVGDLSTLKKIDKRQTHSARDREFKNAMASLEKFVKYRGHFISMSSEDKNFQAILKAAEPKLETATGGDFACV